VGFLYLNGYTIRGKVGIHMHQNKKPVIHLGGKWG